MQEDEVQCTYLLQVDLLHIQRATQKKTKNKKNFKQILRKVVSLRRMRKSQLSLHT